MPFKTHRDNRVILHHRLDNVLVSQGVFTCRIENRYGGFAHHGGDVLVIYSVNLLAHSPDADAAEVHGPFRTNNSIHVPPALSRCWRRRRCWRLIDLYVQIVFQAKIVFSRWSLKFGRHRVPSFKPLFRSSKLLEEFSQAASFTSKSGTSD